MCAKEFRERNITASIGWMGQYFLGTFTNGYSYISNGAYLIKVKSSLIRKGGRLDKMLLDARNLAGENKIVRYAKGKESGYIQQDDFVMNVFFKQFEYKKSDVVQACYRDDICWATLEGREVDLVEYGIGKFGGLDSYLVDIIPNKMMLWNGVFTDGPRGKVHYQKRDKNGELLIHFVLLPIIMPDDFTETKAIKKN